MSEQPDREEQRQPETIDKSEKQRADPSNHATDNFDGLVSSIDSETVDERSGELPRIDRYLVLKRLGEGGMGTVYLAEQVDPVRRRVALKVIRRGRVGDDVVARFDAERQALAMMDHPNIARVFDAGTMSDGRPFFAMEYVDGVSVTEFCNGNSLTIRERLELFVPVCMAIHHAHQKGIIHRDIKPSNILVAEVDGSPIPKVIDFGLAKALGTENALTDYSMETAVNQVLGTVLYMSPEQAATRRTDIDTRSDIYSLGVVLYELLVGSPPIDHEAAKGRSLLELLELVRDQEAPRPSLRISSTVHLSEDILKQRGVGTRQLRNMLRSELDWIVMKSLEKDRNRRYESTERFADDISKFLGDEPISAKPPSVGYRVRKTLRKHRMVAAIALVLTGALLAGVAREHWNRKQIEENLAVSEFQTALLAMQRADWSSAGEYLGNASMHGYPDRMKLRAAELDLAAFTGDVETEQAGIGVIVERSTANRSGSLLLRKADYLRLTSAERENHQRDWVAMLVSAREAGLSEAEEAYADALVAADLSDAIVHCERALALEPQNFKVFCELVAHYLVSQRFEDLAAKCELARYFYPDDPSVWVALAFAATTRGEDDEASRLLREAESTWTPQFAERAMLLVEIFRAAREVEKPWHDELKQAYDTILPRLDRLALISQSPTSDTPGDASGRIVSSRLLVVLTHVMGTRFGMMTPDGLVAPVSTGFAYQGETEELIEQLKRLSDERRDAVIDLYLAELYKKSGQAAKTEEYCVRAMTKPTLFPKLPQYAQSFAAANAMAQWYEGGYQDHAHRKRAAEHGRGRLTRGPITSYQTGIALLEIFYQDKDFVSADRTLADLRRLAPDDELLLKQVSKVRFNNEGDELTAARLALEFLKRNPDDKLNIAVLNAAIEKVETDLEAVRAQRSALQGQ